MAAVFFSDPNRFLGRKYRNDGLPQPNSAVILIRILPLREFRKQISACSEAHRPRHAQELVMFNNAKPIPKIRYRLTLYYLV
jgi:hypothetical protein